jgi:transposase-like protein
MALVELCSTCRSTLTIEVRSRADSLSLKPDFYHHFKLYLLRSHRREGRYSTRRQLAVLVQR